MKIYNIEVPVKKIWIGVAAFMATIILIKLLAAAWYTVDQGARGVVLRNGAIHDDVDPGLHFKLPYFDKVVMVSLQSHKASFGAMPSYSSDQQPAKISVSVNYHVLGVQVREIYSTYGSLEAAVERVLVPTVHKATKEVFGKFTAASVIQERQRFGVDIDAAIRAAMKDKIVIDSVQLENIDFSDAYESSVEQRMLAEVEVQKVRQNWEKEKVSADITRTKAQAEADAKVSTATAEARAIEMHGKAEASAIRDKGAALRDNPALIGLIQAERWDGNLPTTMVPNGALPFLNIK